MDVHSVHPVHLIHCPPEPVRLESLTYVTRTRFGNSVRLESLTYGARVAYLRFRVYSHGCPFAQVTPNWETRTTMTTWLDIGKIRLTTVPGGRFRLDGGAMFGVVPRPLWMRRAEPDEQNRIALATNCTLVETPQATLLIDTGYGTKLTDKEREIFATESLEGVVGSLRAAGRTPDQVDVVVLSHLHFDHAGGGTMRRDDGQIVPTFPRARYVVQRKEWEAATSGLSEWVSSYPPENFACLESSGQLELIDGEEEIVPGVRGIWTGGHSPGHQLIAIEDEGSLAVYLGDLCPTWNHLRQMWCMAYDAHVAEVRRRKPEILGWLADSHAWLLSDHDPERPWVQIRRDDCREFEIVERE